MTHAPNRRWFRYSLRTLFVAMTVVACWRRKGASNEWHFLKR
jgi:hypothetical protein